MPTEPMPSEACVWRRRYERERHARLASEALAEKGLHDLYNNKQLLELAGTIAIKANEATTVDDALVFALKRVCEATGWKLGHAYMVTGNPPLLAPTKLWYGAEDDHFREFREITERSWFQKGRGLAGQVLETGTPSWLPNVLAHSDIARKRVAAKCGLTAAVAFPILAGTEVVGVLEFFLDEPRDPDEPLLRVMGEIGTQLGRVVERKRNEEKLMHDASHDLLTRLPNRGLLLDRMSRALARQHRQPSQRFAVLFIDLDRFKVVNDSLGHAAGDLLLLQVAKRFSTTLRQSDIVSRCVECPDETERGTLARLGGDEFVILLEELHDTSEAARVAQRLQNALTEPFLINGSQLFASASIGIASSDSHYHRAEDMLRDADMAMYRAKSCGKAQYQVFDSRMHLQAVRRLALEQNLRVAYERKQFLLYYMPIVTLSTGVVSGFEALVRWERPGEGIIPPGEFIGLAEETGLIVPIGDWILRQACRTLEHWQSSIPGCTQLTMNVNLSPKQFAQPSLVDDVRSALEETGADPKLLRLEITESCTMENSERAIEVLRQLRKLGTQLSLDDFGTGFSSLSYLHRFPLHNLKIDRSFVSRMMVDTESLAIVRTIILLARDLHLQVTAEGTDSITQIQALEEMGCDYAQGFYYAPPLPEDRAEELLRSCLCHERHGEQIVLPALPR